MGYSHYTRTIDGLERHLGYGVKALCDHPDCTEVIDRGLGYLCGSEPGGEEDGCGRYFCGMHLFGRKGDTPQQCDRCAAGTEPWPMKPDLAGALEDMQWNTPEDEKWAVELSARSRAQPAPP